MAVQGGFDLSQLDAEAAHLDLLVDPPQKLEIAVRPQAGQITGSVHPASGLLCERIGSELFCGQPGPVQVAARQARSRQPKLPGDPERHRETPRVHQEGAGAGQRVADGRWAPVPRGHQGEGRIGRILGRAIQVEDPAHRTRGVEPIRQLPGQRLPRQIDRVDGAGKARAAQQLGGGGRDRVDQPHLTGRGKPGQIQDVARQDHPPSPGERDEELEDREVETDRGRGEDPFQVCGRIDLPRPEGEEHGAAVLDGNPLGAAGRARGVDHVGEVLREHARAGRGPRGRQRPGIEIERLHAAAGKVREAPGEKPTRHQHAGSGVFQNPGAPLLRIGGIDRYGDSAGREGAQQRGHQGRRAVQADRHPLFGPDAELAQPVGDAARLRGELAIGEPLVAVDHGHRIRRAGRLGGEQLVKTAVEARGAPRRRPVVPLEQRLPLFREQQGQVADRPVRRFDGGGQEAQEAAGQAPGGGAVEQGGLVLQGAGERPAAFPEGEREVELGDSGAHAERCQREARHLQLVGRGVLQRKKDLDQGSVGEVALRHQLLDDPVERDVLVAERIQGGGADLREDLLEARRLPA